MLNVVVTVANYSVPKQLGAGEILRGNILILFRLLKYLFCGYIDQSVSSFDTYTLNIGVFWGPNSQFYRHLVDP